VAVHRFDAAEAVAAPPHPDGMRVGTRVVPASSAEDEDPPAAPLVPLRSDQGGGLMTIQDGPQIEYPGDPRVPIRSDGVR
jgi:hypothetical protein